MSSVCGRVPSRRGMQTSRKPTAARRERTTEVRGILAPSTSFVTVSVVEEVDARPMPVHRRERVVPHLDFYLQTGQPSMDLLTAEMSDVTWNDTASAMVPAADERP